jgi:biotin carboxyl carrier protein
MRYYVTIGERTFEVDLTGPTPAVDGRPVRAEMTAIPRSPVRHLLLDGRSRTFVAQQGTRAGEWVLTVPGERLVAHAVDERTRAIREMTGGEAEAREATVVAPMPGMVVRVEVEAGQTVAAGQGVVVVEAMKMENELKASAAGVVARVMVAAGQAVEKGAVLVVFE